MATTAYIKELNVGNNTEEIVYPVTKAAAVWMDDNNTTVQNAVADLITKTNYAGLTKVTTATSGNYIPIMVSNNNRAIDYNNLAKAIIESYASSTLAGQAQSIKQALDTLNSNTKGVTGWIGQLSDKNIDNFAVNVTCGSFWLNCTDSDISGTKPDQSGQGILFCEKQSASLFRETYLGISSNSFKNRYYTYSTNTWSSWADVELRKEIDSLNSSLIEMSISGNGKSATFSKTNGQAFFVIASRFRSSSVNPMRVSLIDQWLGISDIVPNSEIDISASTESVTITNNTTQGAISVLVIKANNKITA